jgi:hypothetical protein
MADATAVWTGQEVILLPGIDSDPVATRNGAPEHPTQVEAYDPATNVWTELAPIPVSPSSDFVPFGIWTGDRLIAAWANADGGTDAGTYDPATDQWQLLSPGWPDGASVTQMHWDGSYVVVEASVGVPGPQGEVAHTTDYRCSADLTTCAEIAKGPIEFMSVGTSAWAGDALVRFGFDGTTGASAAAWDPGSDTWLRLPDLTMWGGVNGEPPATWTGTQLIVFPPSIRGRLPVPYALVPG